MPYEANFFCDYFFFVPYMFLCNVNIRTNVVRTVLLLLLLENIRVRRFQDTSIIGLCM